MEQEFKYREDRQMELEVAEEIAKAENARVMGQLRQDREKIKREAEERRYRKEYKKPTGCVVNWRNKLREPSGRTKRGLFQVGS